MKILSLPSLGFKILKSKKLLKVPIFLALLILLTSLTELNINRSQSLKRTIYLTLKRSTPQVGDLVTIKNHPTKYYPPVTFTKQLIGKAGDKITIKKPLVFINSQPVASLKETTIRGEPLTPIKDTEIPEGYVFVLGNHERSFDSRYEEFGLVKVESLVGRVLPLW